MTTKKILIADDHPAIRRGIKNILASEFPHAQLGEATDINEVFEQLDHLDWDLLILDIDFPGRNGYEVLQKLKSEKSSLPVLVFSFHREEEIALRSIKCGASGYLSKDTADTELINAIQQLLMGKKYISPYISDLLVNQLQNPMDLPAHELLAPREFQTFLLLAKGKTITEIARGLHLSISAINTYRSRILRKMDLKNNAEIAHYAIRNNLV